MSVLPIGICALNDVCAWQNRTHTTIRYVQAQARTSNHVQWE